MTADEMPQDRCGGAVDAGELAMTADEMITADLARLRAIGLPDPSLEALVRDLANEQTETLGTWSQDERLAIYVTADVLQRALTRLEHDRAALGIGVSRQTALADLIGIAQQVWRQMQEEDE